MRASDTERVKLTATWFNSIAAGAISVGFIAPVAALEYLPTAAERSDQIVLFSVIWIVAGVLLHIFARTLLDGLDP